MLKLFNTLTRKIELFKPIKRGKVGLYGCGPTVYDYAHLGNLRAYVFVDLLKRYLEYGGFKVKHVMNITDVDDKTIKGSQENNKTLSQFTNFYAKEFIKDIKALNIKMPDIMPKATEHISEMVDLIKKLKKRGYAYTSDGSTYFKISKFSNYGKLAQLERQALKKGAGEQLNISDEYEKEEAADFVLWKAWRLEDGKVFWNTEIGKGRPGWHIECSAMSMKYLGNSFDIHTGGVDLIFPHHTNEIAQSEGAFGKKFVNYWLHNNHLLVEGEKMSKSLDNFYTLKDIHDRGYEPLLLRVILLKSHYRKILDFSFKNFKEAESVVGKLLDFLISLDLVGDKAKNELNIESEIKKSRSKFKKAMDDDLNISLALSAIFDFINKINKIISSLNVKQAMEIKRYIFEIDSVLGFVDLFYKRYQKRLAKLMGDKIIRRLIKDRFEAREKGAYKKADKIRRDLLNKGVVVNDIKNGYSVRLADIFPQIK